MAKQTITMLTDDLEGGAADETITFGFEGSLYEIDLSAKNAQTLRDFMERYTASGTRKGRLSPTGTYIPGGSGLGQGTRKHGSGVDHPAFAANKELNQKIRAWATRNSYQLAERGRIPQHIVDAYHKGISNPNVAPQDALPLGLADPEPEPEPTKLHVATSSGKTATKTTPVKATRARRSA